jgi:hypothetical protein
MELAGETLAAASDGKAAAFFCSGVYEDFGFLFPVKS